MAAAAILKNRTIAISRPQFKRFRWNLARWHSSTFLAVPIVKNLKFQKSKMAAAAILNNTKITICLPGLERFSRNMAQWSGSTFLACPTIKNLKILKSKITSAAILKIQTLRYLDRDSSDFDKIWHNNVVLHSWPFPPLKIKKIQLQDGGGRHLKTSKNRHIAGIRTDNR